MIVLVCGGRNFKDKDLLYQILDILPIQISKVVNGAAKGADKLSTAWAKDRQIDYKEYPADWDTYPKAAGLIRNSEMLEQEKIDLVIAFPGGNGTKDMATKSKAEGIEVISVRIINGKAKCISSFSKEKSCLNRSAK